MEAGWIIIIAYLFLLLLAVIISQNDTITFNRFQKILVIIITVAGAGLVALSMLIGWTENTSDTVQGLQGRYFLPYLILPVLCIRNRKIIRTGNSDNQSLIWAAGVLLFAAFLCLMCSTFYCEGIQL